MLPINYGILIAGNREMPRVAGLGGKEKLGEGQVAWLIWEGKEGITYLIKEGGNGSNRRTLITFSRKDIKKIQITQYDPILRILFGEQKKQALQKREPGKKERSLK